MSNFGDNQYVGIYWDDSSFYVYASEAGETLLYSENEAQQVFGSFVRAQRDLESAKVNGTHHAISTELLEQLLGVTV